MRNDSTFEDLSNKEKPPHERQKFETTRATKAERRRASRRRFKEKANDSNECKVDLGLHLASGPSKTSQNVKWEEIDHPESTSSSSGVKLSTESFSNSETDSIAKRDKIRECPPTQPQEALCDGIPTSSEPQDPDKTLFAHILNQVFATMSSYSRSLILEPSECDSADDSQSQTYNWSDYNTLSPASLTTIDGDATDEGSTP